jgi:hypothetical protein
MNDEILKSDFFRITMKDWETNYFGRKIAAFEIRETLLDARIETDYQRAYKDAKSIVTKSDSADVTLLETNLSPIYFRWAPLLEELRFRLVDTKMAFLTLLDAGSKERQDFKLSLDGLTIVDYDSKYLDQVLVLTDEHFLRNDSFVSRYKNRLYFPEEEAKRYLRAWVENSLRSDASFGSLLLDAAGVPQGYFIYERKGMRNGIPLYKGILSVVAPAFRGKSTHLALQSHLFSRIPDERYYLDNTTQITNLPIIKNHMKSHRNLDHVLFVFFRSNTPLPTF